LGRKNVTCDFEIEMQTFEFLKVKVEESTLHCARVGYGTHWANFNKKVHKPPYWTLEVARVKKQD
jgi:hypothetical protein